MTTNPRPSATLQEPEQAVNWASAAGTPSAAVSEERTGPGGGRLAPSAAPWFAMGFLARW